ncbi:MAG: FKBP-type peptidyl-prolyl cis-trans isomerase SlyD [Saprospiraceae bacterium]
MFWSVHLLHIYKFSFVILSSYIKERNIMAIIDKNMVVSLHYILREDGQEGELIEDTFGEVPVTFTFGVGQMLPGFEANLKGKSMGEKFAFLLAPGEAYGETKHDSVVDIPLSNFADADGKIDDNAIALGKQIRMKNQNGESFTGLIKEANNTTVKVDFNHPMAGIGLHFSGEIAEVKEQDGLS